MQRDMKVGLAVGVALIGIVGALFFRREPEGHDRDAPPPMKDTKEIDRLIGEKGKAPYMDGIEDYSDRVAPVPPPQNPLTKAKVKTGGDDSPKFGNTDDGRKRERNPQKVVPAPVPAQPLDDGPLAGDPAYAHNRDWEPTGPTVPAVQKAVKKAVGNERPGATGTTGNAARTHVIQAGETLSGLAARYLGSSARFCEIYEANRNVLRSPDDLRDGVTIVIPDAGKSRDVQHASGAGTSSSNNAVKAQSASARSNADGSNSTPAAASPGDAPKEKIRFAPVKGGPFSAGRTAPPAGTTKSNQATDDNGSP